MGNILVRTRHMTTGEWLNWRRKGIGGSDAAVIMGANPYKSLVEVYMEKVGENPATSDDEAIRMGRNLKDFISREFSNRTGLMPVRRFAIHQNSIYPFMLATIDRWLIHQHCGLLCKNTNEFLKDEWEEEKVPERVRVQCQHYMAVTGASKWYVAALIGGNRFRWAKLDRDETFIVEMVKREQAFWKMNIMERVRPEYDGTAGSGDLLNRLYPTAESRALVELPNQAIEWIEQFKEAEQEEERILLRKNEAANRIKDLMGRSERGEAGAYTVTWKNVRRRGTDEPGHRRFKIK